MATFDIPETYADKLEVIHVEDTRSDEEVLASLRQHAAVTSEKNIWAFWHDGLSNMPAWCQRNAIDWVRICGPAWSIRVLDNVPESPNYALRYLSPENLPNCFVQRTMDGPFVGQHSADFVRGASILEHGGAWMDVGSIMTMHMDRICWDRICDPESPYEVATVLRGEQWIFNYFVAARKNNPFIRRWHQLFLHLWKGRNNHEGITLDPLFHYFTKKPAAEQPKEEQQARPQESLDSQTQKKPSGDMALFDWKISMQELLDYASQIAAWNRLALLEDTGDGFSGVEYWSRHILLLDFVGETGMPMALLKGAKEGGARTLALLSMQRGRQDYGKDDIADEQQQEEDHNAAERVVWETLARSSFWKIPHAKGLTHSLQLGSLLDDAANAGKDRAPGTFMELLRYGTVHYRQKRKTPCLREAPRPGQTLRTGLLEP